MYDNILSTSGKVSKNSFHIWPSDWPSRKPNSSDNRSAEFCFRPTLF